MSRRSDQRKREKRLKEFCTIINKHLPYGMRLELDMTIVVTKPISDVRAIFDKALADSKDELDKAGFSVAREGGGGKQ